MSSKLSLKKKSSYQKEIAWVIGVSRATFLSLIRMNSIYMAPMDLTRQIMQMPALGIAHTCVGIAMNHSKHNLGVIYFD